MPLPNEISQALAGLLGVNWNNPYGPSTNAAFLPKGVADPSTLTPAALYQQNTPQIDPLLGTGWDKLLDAAGASQPGGINMAEGQGRGRMRGQGNVRPEFPQQAVSGLSAASPASPSAAPETELRARRVRMQNQEQPAANWTPNAGGFNPFPSGSY